MFLIFFLTYSFPIMKFGFVDLNNIIGYISTCCRISNRQELQRALNAFHDFIVVLLGRLIYLSKWRTQAPYDNKYISCIKCAKGISFHHSKTVSTRIFIVFLHQPPTWCKSIKSIAKCNLNCRMLIVYTLIREM